MKYRIQVDSREFEVTLISRSSRGLRFEIDGRNYEVGIESIAKARTSSPSPITRGPNPPAPSIPKPANRPTPSASAGEVRAPMPGIVVQVIVTPGATVSLGDPLLIIEAMKMENCISAPKSGTVTEIVVGSGKQVAGGEILLRIK